MLPLLRLKGKSHSSKIFVENDILLYSPCSSFFCTLFPTFFKPWLGPVPEFIVEQETSPPFLNSTLRSRVLLTAGIVGWHGLLAPSNPIWASHTWKRAGIWGGSGEGCVCGGEYHVLIAAWNTSLVVGLALVFAWWWVSTQLDLAVPGNPAGHHAAVRCSSKENERDWHFFSFLTHKDLNQASGEKENPNFKASFLLWDIHFVYKFFCTP